MAFVELFFSSRAEKSKQNGLSKNGPSLMLLSILVYCAICKKNPAKMSPEQPQICGVTSSFILLNIFFKLSVSRHLHGNVQKDANILGIFLCVVVSGQTWFRSEVCLVF